MLSFWIFWHAVSMRERIFEMLSLQPSRTYTTEAILLM
jgi:hypothetical protein